MEIGTGSDFFKFHERASWIITNPPWSLARRFLQHAYEVADDIVFLITLNHVLSLRARIADMEKAKFGIKEVLLCKTPDKPWPQSGFQLAAVHFQKSYTGDITWGRLDESAPIVIRPATLILRASAFAIPLADRRIQLAVTSPPFYRLRRYPGGTEKDLGREPTVELYVEHLVLAMREVWRVLRDDGVVFLNITDSYHGSGRGLGDELHPSCSPNSSALRGQGRAKSMCLIPDTLRIALKNDGWIIRNNVIWEKPNAVPESVRDRFTSSYEFIIVMTKSAKYYWNWEEAQEPSVCWTKGSLGGGHTPSMKDGKMKEFTMRHSNKTGAGKTEKRLSTGDVLLEDGSVKWHPVGQGPKGDNFVANGTHGARAQISPPIGNLKHQQIGNLTLVGNRMVMKPTRNGRDVWHINTRPHKESHIAMFPEELVERCIRIGSRPGDTVMDCFGGSGTTGLVARQLDRNSVLMDISEEYVNLMTQRLEGEPRLGADRPTSEGIGFGSERTPFLRQGTTVERQSPNLILVPKRTVPTSFWACPRPRTKHWGNGQVWDRTCETFGTPDAAFGKTDGIPEGIVYYDLSNGFDWKRLPLPDNFHAFGFWDPPYDRMYRPEAMEIWRVCRRLAILHPMIYPTSWFVGARREAMVAVTFGPFKMTRCLQIFCKEG